MSGKQQSPQPGASPDHIEPMTTRLTRRALLAGTAAVGAAVVTKALPAPLVEAPNSYFKCGFRATVEINFPEDYTNWLQQRFQQAALDLIRNQEHLPLYWSEGEKFKGVLDALEFRQIPVTAFDPTEAERKAAADFFTPGDHKVLLAPDKYAYLTKD